MSSDQEKPMALVPVACSVVIQKNGKYLLVQEKRPNLYGLWTFPSGHVDEGETLEQAAIREAKEECGLDVELEGELLVFHSGMDLPVLHAYRAKIIGGEVAFPEDEILDAQWFSFEEIVAMKEKLRNVPYILGAISKSR